MFSFENTELLVACQRNYNDWLHDYATAANGRLYGLAAIPMQDPQAAAAELERVIAMGYKGGCIPLHPAGDGPTRTPSTNLWALAEDAGSPSHARWHELLRAAGVPQKQAKPDSVFE